MDTHGSPSGNTFHTAVQRQFNQSNGKLWNLMIDVMAQSGRYAPGETDLKSFIVEGEQRYWVHPRSLKVGRGTRCDRSLYWASDRQADRGG
jgi:hypothetical protein